MASSSPWMVDFLRHKPRGRIFFGWYVLAATVVLNIFVGGTLAYGFPVFFQAMLAEFGWSLAAAAFAYGILQLEGGALAPLYGWILDRWGTRGPLLIGTAVGALGFFVLSQTNSLGEFYVGFALAGLGFGIYWSGGMAAAANWFEAKRTRAMGISLVGYGLAGFLVPGLALGVDTFGWRAVLAGIAAAAIIICAPLCLVIRHRPERYGLAVDGDDLTTTSRTMLPAQESSQAAPRSLTGSEAIRTRAFWLCSLIYTTSWLPLAVTIPHLLVYLADVGIQDRMAVFAITGITAGTIVGRLGGGFLGDVLDKRVILAVAHGLLGLSLLVFAFTSDLWHLAVFLMLIGPAYGATSPVLPSLIGDLFGSRAFAMILGLSVVPGTLIWFFAPSAAGWVADSFGSYRLAWLTTALVILACAPLALLIPRQIRRPADVSAGGAA